MILADAAKAAREKTVVVSSSTKVLDLIGKMRQDDASSCVRLDGATRHDLRMGLVDRFQHDPGVFFFLLSTKAGGSSPFTSHDCNRVFSDSPVSTNRCRTESRRCQQTGSC
jgi:hypothetical protein